METVFILLPLTLKMSLLLSLFGVNVVGIKIERLCSTCINLYKAKTAIGLVKENLEQAQQRVKDFTNIEKNGLLARNDLMKAELQASNVELALLDAETNYK